ncbi:hypothetical protein [Aquimarina brevivitae]|uniref:Uncharacterized protein n=1 Tax=Aquimarina brevivitae TaxID=323412 RepID=A0A4Q7PFY3_9FLAO|nr:hypothetical protein [Aquimarina brevivitae]RZS99391.1 hypothetical protein EV197_0601 [Aquimarina brevivitae]
MKKLFLLLFVLSAGVSMQAQQNDWTELAKIYDEELYPLAKDVAEITDKVIANKSVISIVKSTGTTSIVKERANDVPVEFYNYKLLTSAGREIKLTDQLMANKVVNKFFEVLRRVKESSKKDNKAEIEAILDSL